MNALPPVSDYVTCYFSHRQSICCLHTIWNI